MTAPGMDAELGDLAAEVTRLREELAVVRAEIVALRAGFDALDVGLIEASMTGSRALARAEALEARVTDWDRAAAIFGSPGPAPRPSRGRRHLAAVPSGDAS